MFDKKTLTFNMTNYIKNTLIFLLIVCSIAGCGFHLRGSFEGKLNNCLKKVYIKTKTPYSQFSNSLRNAFKQATAEVTSAINQANCILVILNTKKTQELMSVSATQSARQYKLVLSTTFQLETKQHYPLTSPKTLTQSRILTTYSNQILSNSNEVKHIYQQIRRNLANDIINYLSSAKINNKLKCVYLDRQ